MSPKRQSKSSRSAGPRNSGPRSAKKSTARVASEGSPAVKKKATKKKAAKKKANIKKSDRDGPQRLQRLLAAAGFGSRRQCEDLIEEGRVDVNGEIVSTLGTVVDPTKDKIIVDGVPLKQQKLVYYAVNKPTGVLSTNSDPRGRDRVIDFVPKSERVYPVGRLDQSSQGLMLLTNDGELAQQLSHPKYGVRKVYRVTVAGKIDGETMRSMRKGIYIAEGFVKVEGARILKARGKATELEITLREGKNREIRRILARLGHKVQVLRRIAIGPLRLGDLPTGAYRALTKQEVQRLRKAVEFSQQEVEDDAPPRRYKGTKKKTSKVTGKRAGHSGGKPSKGKGPARGPAKGKGSGKGASAANRTDRKTPTSKFTFLPKEKEGGSIIGGD